MKKKYEKILSGSFIIVIIILLIISIIIISNNNSNNDINKEKIYYQIKYIDNQINDLFKNCYNNNYISWNEFGTDIKYLYDYWNSAILDFNNLEIDKQYLTNFGKILDDVAISINNQNKQETLKKLLILYKNLIIYSETLNYNSSYTNILYAKYNLLKAYSIAENKNWTLIYENVLECGNFLLNTVNSIENNKYSQYNINQAYISVKELENIINVKDIDIFYMKFKVAIEKIENIQFDF